MLPIDLSHWSHTAVWLLHLAVGLGFGAVLEAAGFGDSRRLAAQFYLREMRVLQVMFGAIITAAVLIVLGSSLGLVDYSQLFVNPTFLPSQVLGGLIMGVGFIVGGFCPGTSLVASATFKVDGIVFLLGVVTGIFAFGESVGSYEPFYEAWDWGRYTIGDWLHIDLGWALLIVVLMALAMFYGGELAESVFGEGRAWKDVPLKPKPGPRLAAAAALVALSLWAGLRGQPDAAAKWKSIEPKVRAGLVQRQAFAHPLEVVELKQNAALKVLVLDVRDESAFNLFHLKDAELSPPARFDDPLFIRRLQGLEGNTVVLVMGQAETQAVAAWKRLQAERVNNAYIVEGGYNGWWKLFPPEPCLAVPLKGADPAAEGPTYAFNAAVGERSWAAHPDCGCDSDDLLCPGTPARKHGEAPPLPKVAFEHKVKVTVKAVKKGGCG
jgi:rhodanese-related sulfurtransferase